MKKFRELRMTILCAVICIIMFIISIIQYINQNKGGLIGAILLLVIALMLLLTRYKMVMYDDMMMIYEWKIVAMLPSIIEYKDIQEIKALSKHRVFIKHKHKSKIYVFNSQRFLDSYYKLKGE